MKHEYSFDVIDTDVIDTGSMYWEDRNVPFSGTDWALTEQSVLINVTHLNFAYLITPNKVYRKQF